MKLYINNNKAYKFYIGIIMLVIGLIILVRNIYVTTPFYTGQFTVGGIYLRSGILILPLLIGLVWMFFKRNMVLPKVLCILGFILIIIVAVTSVTIRVGSVSLVKWLLILFFIVGGLILSLSSIIIRKEKNK